MRKKLFLFFVFFFLLAGNNCFAAINIEVPLLNIPNPTLPQYIAFFFQLAIILGGVLAVLSLIFSGIQFIYSFGNPTTASEAKKRATNAILGLILLLSSFILIRTINPELESLDPVERLDLDINTFYFSGGSGRKTAPTLLENLDAIKQEGHTIIGWDSNYCNRLNPNLVYNIYWYRDYNLKNLALITRLRCGQTSLKNITAANSYLIVKESPGVYFYEGPNCMPLAGSNNNYIPTTNTQSIPEDIGIDGKNVRSIRVVNGPNPIKGPFFGIVYFNSTDYKTGESSYGYQHFLFHRMLSADEIFNNNSYCISGSQFGSGANGLPSRGVSWVIYKWVGYKEDGTTTANAGSGTTLYTEVSWSGGFRNFIDAYPSGGFYWWYDLGSTEVYYPQNTTIPRERRDVCPFFNPVNSCLKSFEIKGSYLVLVLSGLIPPGRESETRYYQNIKVQAFPISSRLQEAYRNRPAGYSVERGTPELESDYMGSKNAYFMEIIPLAERLR